MVSRAVRDERRPSLFSDMRRLWIATAAGMASAVAISVAFAVFWIRQDARPEVGVSTTAGVVGMAVVMFALYQVLTWVAFASLDGVTLRRFARETNPRSEADRWRNMLLGNGPKSWSVVAAGAAMLAVLVVIIDERLRTNAVIVVAALLCVALSWVMIAFAFAVSYLRHHADHPGALRFPGAEDGEAPVWRDYVYLAFQVSATFSSSDVELATTEIRGQVTAHTIIAFTFNSVVVALLVSALTLVT